ncbi:MAG: sigma-54-dependent Fis family transcriptional regulator, partial [Deltaproteobacteria bacterium]|nr:sigma-54-dependent Fis family transcriptional regulator [Deltaproteobacteria bacterium]
MDLAKKICIVDDDMGSCELIKGFCEQHGFGSQVFLSSQEAIKFLEQFDNKNKNPFSLIICDLKMPEIDGIEFINRLNYLDQKPPVILLTAHGSVDTAIECLNSGAADYLTKPVNFNELLIICNRAIKIHEMEEDYTLLKKELYKTYLLEDMVGKSTQIKNVFEFIQKVSKVSCNVLITGESGTGKEMVARAIHNQQFKSNSGIPFVAINCSSIPETLLESELFGHAKGSFTGATNCRRGLLEDANGGTVFLDEIGELPVYLQAKLLRFLQERKIKPVGDNTYKYLDVRIIAATNMNLKEATKVGTFREDLYFRMCVAPIEIPPLRH